MYIVPENLRDILKEPIGRLVDEKKLLEILKDKEKIISIGDTVTYTLLKNGFEPVFCIVDYKTHRGVCEDEVISKIKSFGKKSINVKNPPGVITDDLCEVIKIIFENLNSGPFRIEVEGEEDLASLIVLFFAPSDVTIIYGLPDKGVLVVKPTKEIKDKVKKVLDIMRCE
jgi:GTP-dependent dephospho-CoA kinase